MHMSTRLAAVVATVLCMPGSNAVIPAGTQTLVRGLSILELVARAVDGATIQQIADSVDIHRTMATRSLQALADFNLVRRGSDGRFRIAAGVVALARDYQPDLRNASRPVLEHLAETLNVSACLFVEDGDEVVAVQVVEPQTDRVRLTFKIGSRHPIDLGSAAYAIAAVYDERPDERPEVGVARRDGFSRSHGEVEPGAFGVSVPVDLSVAGIAACVHVLSFQESLSDNAVPYVLEAAREIERVLGAG